MRNRVEEVLFAVDVAVDRHHPALEAAGQVWHRERIEAALVGQRECSLDHLLTS